MEKRFPLKTLIAFLILAKFLVIFWVLNNLLLFRESLAYLAHKPIKARFPKEEIQKDLYFTKEGFVNIYGISRDKNKPLLLFFINHLWQGSQVSFYAHLAQFFSQNFNNNFLQVFISFPKTGLFFREGEKSYYQREKEFLHKFQDFLLQNISRYGGDMEKIYIFAYESGATFALNFIANSLFKVKGVLFMGPILPSFYAGGNAPLFEKNYFFLKSEEEEAYTLWQKNLAQIKKVVVFSYMEIPLLKNQNYIKENFQENPLVALFRIGRGENYERKIIKSWQDILD